MKPFSALVLVLLLHVVSLTLFAQTESAPPQVRRTVPTPDETRAGIGAVLAIQDGQLVVTQTTPGGAAAPVVRAGDRVVKIDGTPVSATLAENIERIRGAAGSELGLEVERFVRQSLPGGLRVPVTLTRAALPSAAGADKATTAGYLRELAVINRHYLINTTYLPPFGTDKMSLGYRLRQLVELEAAAGKEGRVPEFLRSQVRAAIQNDFEMCQIIGTWDDDSLTNLRDLYGTAAKTGINLFRSGDIGGDFRGFVGRVMARSLETMAAYSAYSRDRAQQDPHSEWVAGFGEVAQTPVDLAPFGMSDLAFVCNPHWQFQREDQAPTDRKQGYGLDYPGLNGQQTNVRVPMDRGIAKIRLNNVRATQRWRLDFTNVPRAKYFFAMIEMESGVLGLNSYNGPPCTWASAFDAWEFNHGVIGGNAGIADGIQIDHLPMPVLGKEGAAATGNVYVWFTDELAFPEQAREMAATVVISE